MEAFDSIMPGISARLGGRWKRDHESGVFEMAIGDFVLEAEPFATTNLTGLDCAVAHVKFGALINAISGDPPETFVCLEWFQKSANVEATPEAFAHLMQEAIARIRTLQLPLLLSQFMAKPHGKTTVPQLCHLAALAWGGHFVEIMEYRDALNGSGYNPLVPYITHSMVDRAFDEAVSFSA